MSIYRAANSSGFCGRLPYLTAIFRHPASSQNLPDPQPEKIIKFTNFLALRRGPCVYNVCARAYLIAYIRRKSCSNRSFVFCASIHVHALINLATMGSALYRYLSSLTPGIDDCTYSSVYSCGIVTTHCPRSSK